MFDNSLGFVFCVYSKSVTPNVSNVISERSNKISVMKERWKELEFGGKFFTFNCCKCLVHLFKPGLHISCKIRKHMFANTFFKLSSNALVFT